MIVYCATGNAGKLREFQAAAAGLDLRMLPGYRQLPPCEETGATFEENAIQKALHYSRYAEGLLFADDSGPGSECARWSAGGPFGTLCGSWCNR